MRTAAVIALALGVLATGGGGTTMAADANHRQYEAEIKPLLARRCQACHGALAQEAGLRLDTAALARTGGDSGPAVLAGDAASSLLVARISDPDPLSRMPPEGEGEPLTSAEVALLSAWIDAGAPAPEDEQPEADPRDHWAFQPLKRPPIPSMAVASSPSSGNEPLHPLDAFINSRLTAAGLTPQGEAPQHVLIRRLYLDLLGVPPSPSELTALMADTSSDWYPQLVDQLLNDPRYGQRWARHWMDIWRYSDWWGLGKQLRNSQEHMWHFRDWIVESLNDDLGYDEMVRLMLAADELHPDDLDRLRATGFLARNWFLFNRTPWMDDTVEHVGKAFLGLTTNCAKCHDHKYDPISQKNYYQLRAFFEPLHVRIDVVPGQPDLASDGVPRVFDALLDEPTYRFERGDDSKPDTSEVMQPGVPDLLAFDALEITPVSLPKTAFEPARRPWVIEAHISQLKAAVETATTSTAPQAVPLAKARLAACEQRATATRARWTLLDADANADLETLQAEATATARAAVKAEREVARLQTWISMEGITSKLSEA
ncbi:DUF1549 domain-containing protein, partial [bacterium]|nr:DUF1549 domain-containing protein [bacterium]